METAKSDYLSMQPYFQDISALPQITRSEEEGIAKLARLGDVDARNKLILSNLRFVISVAQKFRGRGVPLEDLVAYGNVGLITAAERFDPGLGFKFITYAVWWIRQSIQTSVSHFPRLVRLPENRSAILRKTKAIIREASEDRIGLDQIARELSIHEDTLRDTLELAKTPLSFDEPIQKDASAKRGDFIADDVTLSPLESASRSEMREVVDQALSLLTARQQFVIRAYFGIGSDQKTLQEIGEDFGVTRERVRQIREEGICKLKRASAMPALRAMAGEL